MFSTVDGDKTTTIVALSTYPAWSLPDGVNVTCAVAASKCSMPSWVVIGVNVKLTVLLSTKLAISELEGDRTSGTVLLSTKPAISLLEGVRETRGLALSTACSVSAPEGVNVSGTVLASTS